MNNKMSSSNWLSLLGLTFAAFIFNTSEFVPVGLLTDIKTDFGLTEASVGMLISVYAWAVMILSLPLMLIVSKMEMKRLMLCLLGIFSVFQFMSFASTSYAMLMCSRVGVACAHAVFWSVVSPIAVRIVPERHRSVALSMVATGSSIAMVLGMPLGRIIGLHVGWRITFLSIGVFSALTFLYTAWRLPKMPSGGGFSPKQLPELFRRRGVVGLFVFTLFISTSIYVAYSYIEPFLKTVSLMPDGWVTAALMAYGGAGFLGSIAFAKYYSRGRKTFITVLVAAMTACLLLLQPVASSTALIIILLIVWGAANTAYNVAMQSNVMIVTTPESAPVAMSIFSGIFNLGIGSGAFIGGIICTTFTISYIGIAGGIIGIAGLIYWTARLGSRI